MESKSTPLHAGQKVKTPHGAGRVQYVRMAPPDFTAVEAVSVLLDGRAAYGGTIYAAKDVVAIEEADE